MSKYGAIIAEARKPIGAKSKKEASISGKEENQKTRNNANQKSTKAKVASGAVKEEEVNLSIKVALRRRRYWMGQAKLKGETLTEAITNALSKRYGEPQD